MNNDMKKRLYRMIDSNISDRIEGNYSAMLNEMCREQEQRLSPTQFKKAKKLILTRIAFYLSIKKHIDGEDALVYVTNCFHAKVEGASKLMKFLSRYEWGYALFRKVFSIGLRADTWVSEIKRNDKDIFVFDITKCLYKDLCEFYKCPELCTMFCGGDWVVFGDMIHMEFERKHTLGHALTSVILHSRGALGFRNHSGSGSGGKE